jgi:hypothetical protein
VQVAPIEIAALSSRRPHDQIEAALTAIVRALWWGYRHTAARLEEVETASITPLVTGVEPRRVDQAGALVDAALAAGLQVFDAYVATSAPDECTLIPPPIVEAHGTTFTIVDGVHRVWAARSKKLPLLNVLVVRGSLPKLPRRPSRWNDLVFEEPPRTLEQIMGVHDATLFRPVATTIGNLTFSTQAELLHYVDEWATGARSEIQKGGKHVEL